MCLAVPGQIIEVTEAADQDPTGRIGVVDLQGSRIEASLAMVPEAACGDWVLVHAGFALTTLDADEARDTWDSLREAFGDEIELPPSPPPPAPPAGE